MPRQQSKGSLSHLQQLIRPDLVGDYGMKEMTEKKFVENPGKKQLTNSILKKALVYPDQRLVQIIVNKKAGLTKRQPNYNYEDGSKLASDFQDSVLRGDCGEYLKNCKKSTLQSNLKSLLVDVNLIFKKLLPKTSNTRQYMMELKREISLYLLSCNLLKSSTPNELKSGKSEEKIRLGATETISNADCIAEDEAKVMNEDKDFFSSQKDESNEPGFIRETASNESLFSANSSDISPNILSSSFSINNDTKHLSFLYKIVDCLFHPLAKKSLLKLCKNKKAKKLMYLVYVANPKMRRCQDLNEIMLCLEKVIPIVLDEQILILQQNQRNKENGDNQLDQTNKKINKSITSQTKSKVKANIEYGIVGGKLKTLCKLDKDTKSEMIHSDSNIKNKSKPIIHIKNSVPKKPLKSFRVSSFVKKDTSNVKRDQKVLLNSIKTCPKITDHKASKSSFVEGKFSTKKLVEGKVQERKGKIECKKMASDGKLMENNQNEKLTKTHKKGSQGKPCQDCMLKRYILSSMKSNPFQIMASAKNICSQQTLSSKKSLVSILLQVINSSFEKDNLHVKCQKCKRFNKEKSIPFLSKYQKKKDKFRGIYKNVYTLSRELSEISLVRTPKKHVTFNLGPDPLSNESINLLSQIEQAKERLSSNKPTDLYGSPSSGSINSNWEMNSKNSPKKGLLLEYTGDFDVGGDTELANNYAINQWFESRNISTPKVSNDSLEIKFRDEFTRSTISTPSLVLIQPQRAQPQPNPDLRNRPDAALYNQLYNAFELASAAHIDFLKILDIQIGPMHEDGFKQYTGNIVNIPELD